MKMSRMLSTLIIASLIGTGLVAQTAIKISLYMPGDPAAATDMKSVMEAAKAYSVAKTGAYLDVNIVGWGEFSLPPIGMTSKPKWPATPIWA